MHGTTKQLAVKVMSYSFNHAVLVRASSQRILDLCPARSELTGEGLAVGGAPKITKSGDGGGS